MLLIYFATALVGFISFVYFFFYHPLNYWKVRGVPYVEPEFYYGNSRGLGTTVHVASFYQKMYKKLKGKGPVAGTYWFSRPKLLAVDLDFVKQILVKDFNIFANRGLYFNEVDDPLSANLVNLEDEAWKNLRHKVTPVFTSGKLKLMCELVSQTADKLVETIRRKSLIEGSVEVKSLFVRYTVDNMASTAFGIESNAVEDGDSEFLRLSLKSGQPVSFFVRNIAQKYRNLGRLLKFCETPKNITQMLFDTVRKMIQFRNENPEYHRNDFMSTMIKLHDPSLEDPLTINQVVALATEILFAGYEGASSTLTFCLNELSQSTELQEKARESVKQGLEKHGGVLNYESMNEMAYLEQCINETFRKHPPTTGLSRVAAEDYRIPNTDIVIEKGMKVNVPVCAIHHDPDIYPDPSKFDPDRFSPEEIAKRHPFAFIPFGAGPRVCIGNRFAKIQIKMALAKILNAFEFGIDDSKKFTREASKQGLTLNASNNYHISFRKIKN